MSTVLFQGIIGIIKVLQQSGIQIHKAHSIHLRLPDKERKYIPYPVKIHLLYLPMRKTPFNERITCSALRPTPLKKMDNLSKRKDQKISQRRTRL